MRVTNEELQAEREKACDRYAHCCWCGAPTSVMFNPCDRHAAALPSDDDSLNPGDPHAPDKYSFWISRFVEKDAATLFPGCSCGAPKSSRYYCELHARCWCGATRKAHFHECDLHALRGTPNREDFGLINQPPFATDAVVGQSRAQRHYYTGPLNDGPSSPHGRRSHPMSGHERPHFL